MIIPMNKENLILTHEFKEVTPVPSSNTQNLQKKKI